MATLAEWEGEINKLSYRQRVKYLDALECLGTMLIFSEEFGSIGLKIVVLMLDNANKREICPIHNP